MTLITHQEILIINAARRALADISERTQDATFERSDNVYEDARWYKNRGRLIEQAHGAESSLFRVLNVASSYCEQDVNDWLMHLRVPTVEQYAEKLVLLVEHDRAEFVPQYDKARSWQDLHDVCDANEYLIAADEKFGLEFGSEEHIQFCNEAIALAEKTLFGKEDS